MTHKCKHSTGVVPDKRFGVLLYRAQCKLCGARGRLRWRFIKAWSDCDAMEASDDEQ